MTRQIEVHIDGCRIISNSRVIAQQGRGGGYDRGDRSGCSRIKMTPEYADVRVDGRVIL